MNGMVPYVDFADSKGPLLWLIYGLGYLISHHSYIGVFWISILFYTATLFTAYKLCRLFADKEVSAVSVAALPFFLFCFICHFEIRAEDFCYPFIMLALYCTCRILKYRDSDARTYFKLSALMGVCSMCCVLIKYNIGCMIMGLMAVVLYMAVRNKAGWQSFWGMFIGFIVPAVPFVICFMLFYGNMGAFIQEYFLNTFQTIENHHHIITLIKNKKNVLLICFMFLGLYYISKKHKLGYWLIPCFLLFMVGMGGAPWVYYYTVLLPFSVFLVLSLVDFTLNKIPRLQKSIVALCFVALVCSISINLFFYYRKILKVEEDTKSNYYTAAYVMSQIKDPKIFNYKDLELGIGMPVGALPACRHWFNQAGATEEMKKDGKETLRNKVADFVCINSSNEDDKEEIEQYGYVFYCNAPRYNTKRSPKSLYGRPGLKLPPEDFHVSQWDVWLKRNIFGI